MGEIDIYLGVGSSLVTILHIYVHSSLQQGVHFEMAKYLPLLLGLVSNLLSPAYSFKSPDCFEGYGGGVSLTTDFYQTSCPEAESIILSWVEKAVRDDPRMAASLLRLHFHDCFVNGCDASVLLDDTPTFIGEKTAPPNLNSLRGFEVIDAIKADLEEACPQTVSCADILAAAARDSVVLSGGPGWDVEMGRRDSTTADKVAAVTDIPSPGSDVATLVAKFEAKGLNIKDMVALSGAHTIGKARCSSFTSRLTSDVNSAFVSSLQQLCNGNSTVAAVLDLVTPATFDNQYYINLVSGEGLLSSDQALVSTHSPARHIVESYATSTDTFFQDFPMSMLKMGSLGPTTFGQNGQIRGNCRTVN